MLVCPRWEKVRRVGPQGVGPPLLLNRYRGYRVVPCAQREYMRQVSFPALGAQMRPWWEPEHRNVPAGAETPRLRRAMGLRDFHDLPAYSAVAAGWLASQQLPARAVIGDPGLTGAGSGTNITISTANIGTGVRLLLGNGLTLNNFYYFVGTNPTNNTLQYNVSAGTNSLPTTPATPTILGPTNTTTATGWVNIASLSSALSANQHYWAWLSDSAAPQATNAAIRRNFGAGALGPLVGPYYAWEGASTATDYWATAGNRTFAANAANICLTFSGAGTVGLPFTAIANSAADTNEKGLRLSGLTAALKVYAGYAGASGSNNLTGLNIYSGTTAPSGTGDVARSTTAIFNDTSGGPLTFGFLFATPPTLAASTTYHLTYTFSASATGAVQRVQIGTGADSNLKAAMFGGSNWYYARANGTTDFTNDATDEWPKMLIEIEDLVAAAAGGAATLFGAVVR